MIMNSLGLIVIPIAAAKRINPHSLLFIACSDGFINMFLLVIKIIIIVSIASS